MPLGSLHPAQASPPGLSQSWCEGRALGGEAVSFSAQGGVGVTPWTRARPASPALSSSVLVSGRGCSTHGQGPPGRGRALAPKAPALASTWGPQMSPECPASPRAHRERCRAQREGNRQIRVRSISISDIRQSHKSEQLTGWKTTFLCPCGNREAVTKCRLTIWGIESCRKQLLSLALLRLGSSAPPSS